MTKPILLIGYGNPSRGDDALGCLLLDTLEQTIDLTDIDLLTDFQLQIEHALDLQHRQLVLFADAEVNARQAFTFTELQAVKDNSFSSHAISPASVLEVYQNITGLPAPPCFLLSIQAESFELGEGLSATAKANFDLACEFVGQLFNNPQLDFWRQIVAKGHDTLPNKVFQQVEITDETYQDSQVQQ